LANKKIFTRRPSPQGDEAMRERPGLGDHNKEQGAKIADEKNLHRDGLLLCADNAGMSSRFPW
jgi:hypothetical protein